jgi:hypothetical protein
VGSTPTPGMTSIRQERADSSGGADTVGMNTAIILLAVAGVIAVGLRLVRALFATLRGGVDAFLAHDVADTRAQRGDLTGVDDARAAARVARKRRLLALGTASMWIGLLLVPVLTPWPTLLYAGYSLLWLIPRRPRHAPRT